MSHTRYETDIDSNFIMAYDTYNQQVADEERALLRARRNEPRADDRSTRDVDTAKPPRCDRGPPEPPSTVRGLVTAAMIGYTAAILMYCLSSCATDGETRQRGGSDGK